MCVERGSRCPIYRNGGAELSPAYDLMSTAIYPEVGRRMAMKIDGEYEFRWITRGKFLRMGEKSGISANIVEKALNRMSVRICREAPRLASSAARKWPSGCYAQIVAGIQARAAAIRSA